MVRNAITMCVLERGRKRRTEVDKMDENSRRNEEVARDLQGRN